MNRHTVFAAACCAVLVLACSAPRPADLDELLEPAPRAEQEAVPALTLRTRCDALAAELRAAAQARPQDGELALAASRALFQAANARILAASLERCAARPEATVEQLIDVEDHLPEAVRGEVLGLVLEGGEHAERARKLLPERPAALLYRALHLSLEAWARGSSSALVRGLGRAVPSAIQAAIDADPGLESAAPLRLMGRFLDRAPWPVGNAERAREHLARAVELAPIPLNFLYLGDALWSAGHKTEARSAWTSASEASAGPATRETAPIQRELARWRLARSVAGSTPAVAQ